MLLMHWALRAASRADLTAGRSRAIRTAMSAITTRSSISVKPRLRESLCARMRNALVKRTFPGESSARGTESRRAGIPRDRDRLAAHQAGRLPSNRKPPHQGTTEVQEPGREDE